MEENKRKSRITAMFSNHFSTLVLLVFIITVIVFFILPVFLNPSHEMQFFNYVPTMNPIGNDFRDAQTILRAWNESGRTEYSGLIYPPLANIILGVFQNIDLVTGYTLITCLSLACFLLMTLVFPPLLRKKKKITTLQMLLLITGLFSYGFQFELERGQFNVITLFFCFLAIWIFHSHPKYRILAYLFLSLAIQLKVYPAIFILLLIDDWRDWKGIIKRFLGLGLFNFALLFVLGLNFFNHFIRLMSGYGTHPFIWIGNHSIISYVSQFIQLHENFELVDYAKYIQIFLFVVVLSCILLILFWSYRRNKKGVNPYLLLACTIGALIIPSTSHDYTLPLLIPAVIFLFDWFDDRLNLKPAGIGQLLLMLLLSGFYFITLFPETNKNHLILQNNFPTLLGMLVATTILAFLTFRDKPSEKIIEKKTTIKYEPG